MCVAKAPPPRINTDPSRNNHKRRQNIASLKCVVPGSDVILYLGADVHTPARMDAHALSPGDANPCPRRREANPM